MSAKARRTTIARNLALLDALDKLEAAAKREGIAFLTLKGAAFLDTLYPDLERPMLDVDLLVRPADRPRLGRLLEAQGYARKSARGRPVTEEEHYEWVYYRAPQLIIEVHARLCQREKVQIDDDELWRRATTYHGANRQIVTLGPEDSLLYAALHQANHTFIVEPRVHEDTRRIITRWHPNWRVVVERARRWQVATSLYIALRCATRPAGDDSVTAPLVPRWVLTTLRPSAARRLWIHTLVDVDRGRARMETPLGWRLTQLAGLPLAIDQPSTMLEFLATYGWLRLRDLLAHHGRR